MYWSIRSVWYGPLSSKDTISVQRTTPVTNAGPWARAIYYGSEIPTLTRLKVNKFRFLFLFSFRPIFSLAFYFPFSKISHAYVNDDSHPYSDNSSWIILVKIREFSTNFFLRRFSMKICPALFEIIP